MTLADRLVVMNGGMVEQGGPLQKSIITPQAGLSPISSVHRP
ncbi:hypothetical protein RGCCGE502_28943 (plasmid) [Rhizobium grahamii CCGE 502]|uniref:Uncharacterized protein n=1 Tax=Rhizobium grahamii CCGE 502 TaxID=990285 RepID=S3H8U3_9HYPH|nr:hypothetical protein RGCCGE502_28943 [Rhizobium grahamii CCGE 502]